jgi:hypothetical protein
MDPAPYPHSRIDAAWATPGTAQAPSAMTMGMTFFMRIPRYRIGSFVNPWGCALETSSHAQKAQQDTQVQQDAQKQAEADQQAQQHSDQYWRNHAIHDLERHIKKDAVKDVNDGLLQGPIIRVQCDPGTAGDATNTTQSSFDCTVVTKVNVADGTESGYQWTGTINFNSGAMSWHPGGSGVTP